MRMPLKLGWGAEGGKTPFINKAVPLINSCLATPHPFPAPSFVPPLGHPLAMPLQPGLGGQRGWGPGSLPQIQQRIHSPHKTQSPPPKGSPAFAKRCHRPLPLLCQPGICTHCCRVPAQPASLLMVPEGKSTHRFLPPPATHPLPSSLDPNVGVFAYIKSGTSPAAPPTRHINTTIMNLSFAQESSSDPLIPALEGGLSLSKGLPPLAAFKTSPPL